MSEPKKYIGVTVGPIFDTINLTSSPAALWAASYIFSMTSRSVCEKLLENGVDESDIVVPFYSKNSELLLKNDGIGLFHDRIFFKSEKFNINKMTDIRSAVICDIAGKFGINDDYLKQYIMIASAEFDVDIGENVIFKGGRILDSLELAKTFVFKETDGNPILDLFTNHYFDKYDEQNSKDDESVALKKGKNEQIKKLTASFSDFQLWKTDKYGNVIKTKDNDFVLKSLYDICRTGHGKKKYNYYAIVRADGDNMSNVIGTLDDDKKIKDFSAICMKYCADVAMLVKEYDGVTIYAGGDDLLAILPCEARNGKTVFEFTTQANEIFLNAFKEKYNINVSLSFGISINYYKFPLYEALEESAHLLFDIAKAPERKNGVAVRLQKHAGQSEGLFIPNAVMSQINELCKLVIDNDKKYADKKNSEKTEEILLSAMHKTTNFESLFKNTTDKTTIQNLFNNVFDAADHENNDFVHKDLPKLYMGLQTNLNISVIDDKDVYSDNSVLAFNYILRIIKFFIEKKEENV